MGIANFNKRHKNSAQCRENKKKKKIQDTIEKTKLNAAKFFAPRPPKIPATVSAPPRITLRPIVAAPIPSSSRLSPSPSHPHSTIPSACPKAADLLIDFRRRIELLPESVGRAGDDHPLAQFAGDPTGCVEEDEDAWEKFDRPLNTVLQKPLEDLKALVRVGEKGLIGLCRFLEYLVYSHGLQGGLIEGP